MKELAITIEIDGKQQIVGYIRGNDYRDACFCYDESYLSEDKLLPISVSLPKQKEAFSSIQTRCFFEGLLPEGFSRRAVAEWMKADVDDYITILEVLGQECLGAIAVTAVDHEQTLDNHEQTFDNYWQNSKYQLLENSRVKELAAEGASTSTQLLVETHLSLTGASGKVGLYYDENSNKWYLPMGAAPSSHIVKQSHVKYKGMVLNEQICIETARLLGIAVPDSFIVDVGIGSDEDILYATRRYDRIFADKEIDGLKVPLRRHQEDFAQAIGIEASQKYEMGKSGYLKKMFDLISRVSANPVEDHLRLWDEIIFNYLIGNADCHLKNYSILYSADMKSIRLAPAYDIVCTKIYSTTRNNSIYIADKINIDEISRSDFSQAANEVGLGNKIAMSHFDDLSDRFSTALDTAIENVENKGFIGAREIGKKIKENIRA